MDVAFSISRAHNSSVLRSDSQYIQVLALHEPNAHALCVHFSLLWVGSVHETRTIDAAWGSCYGYGKAYGLVHERDRGCSLHEAKMSSEDAAAEKAAEAEEEELEAAYAQPHTAEIRHVPKDPRTKARWNIVSRLLFM